MSDESSSAAKPKVIFERALRAEIDELWDLWTTAKGFESWWGPEGFRVEVRSLEARVGGALQYAMIADAPEQIEAMKRMGQPTSQETRGSFTDVTPHERLAITHLIDFVAGVSPYESTAVVELFPSGDRVRMVITLDPMHDAEWTRRATMGWTSQLVKLERRFRERYSGSCHCGAVRFRFKSGEITSGCRCNCSICIRKGTVMSEYIAPDAFELEGGELLAVYQFGDKDVRHYFCKTCGICPFTDVASLPPTYQGRAKIGDRRVNLGCIEGLDPLALKTEIINGRAF